MATASTGCVLNKQRAAGRRLDRGGNQRRILLTAAAYVLLQEVCLRAAGTACAHAQVGLLRERLLKLGARVEVSVRRVLIHFPVAFPFRSSFDKIALAFGAQRR